MTADAATHSPVHRFDTRGLEPEEGFAIWRDLFSPLFEIDLPDRGMMDRFRGSMENHHLGGVLLGRCTTVTQIFRRDSQVIARSGLDHYLIQLLCGGTSRGTMGQRDVDVGPGDVCLLDLAQTVRTLDQDIDALSLCVPRAFLAPLLADPDGLHGLVLPASSPLGAMVGHSIRALARVVNALSAREAHAVARGTTALIAGCIGPSIAERDRVSEHAEVARVIAIRRFIDAHLGEPDLGPARICDAFAVSRPTLYRLFEPMGGVVAFILQRRLARSLADLMSPRHPRVADVARRWGFSSEAVFSRAFRAAYGISPRDAQAGAWPMELSGADASGGFKRWLQELAVL
ncbi:MAG: helix-turn-helix domain-containing protein [Pseudomonadota bacterium]